MKSEKKTNCPLEMQATKKTLPVKFSKLFTLCGVEWGHEYHTVVFWCYNLSV